MKKQYFNIAIDGPAGAGKSTIAKAVAERLNFIYVDTGAMYRAMALHFLRQGIASDDEAGIAVACDEISITLEYQNEVQQVLLNGENVSGLIRTEEVGKMTSAISIYQCVREKLLQLQRDFAAQADVLMDGRDIGTCVLPNANVKIYLTASSRIRAQRRYQELIIKDMMCNLEEIEQAIIERDFRDMNRQIAPLKQASDAILLDGSDLTIEEVVQQIISISIAHGLQVKE